jgi:hypothetical protein
MQFTKVTADDVASARKAGFKKKKPVKPKGKITEAKVKAYSAKYNDWAKGVKEAAKKHKDTQKLKDMIGAL